MKLKKKMRKGRALRDAATSSDILGRGREGIRDDAEATRRRRFGRGKKTRGMSTGTPIKGSEK